MGLTIPARLQAENDRWYPLKKIPIQTKLIKSKARFKIVPAGRRSGKTERAKRHLIKTAWKLPGLYFVCAPTYKQVKKIYWDDLLLLTFSSQLAHKPNKTELIIYLDNGSQIHLMGLEDPTRFEGPAWDGGIIDEAAYLKEDVLNGSIFPALNTFNPSKPDYKAWAWIIGKPNGRNHYYYLYQHAIASNDPEFEGFHWKSSVVLDKKTLEKAKRLMPARLYRQEYEATFETAEGLIYDEYSKDNHTDVKLLPQEQICYFCDFNFSPMSHGIGFVRDGNIYLVDEIILHGATAKHNAIEFIEKYKDHENKHILIYGDRSGKNGEKHGLETEYTIMERLLSNAGWKVEMRVQNANPAIKDRQNAVRAKICNTLGERSLFVNPDTAPWIDRALASVMVKEGSTFLEDDKDEYQHITTAIGYFVNYEWPVDDKVIGEIVMLNR